MLNEALLVCHHIIIDGGFPSADQLAAAGLFTKNASQDMRVFRKRKALRNQLDFWRAQGDTPGSRNEADCAKIGLIASADKSLRAKQSQLEAERRQTAERVTASRAALNPQTIAAQEKVCAALASRRDPSPETETRYSVALGKLQELRSIAAQRDEIEAGVSKDETRLAEIDKALATVVEQMLDPARMQWSDPVAASAYSIAVSQPTAKP